MSVELNVFNPFVPSAPFLYPLKTSENRLGGRERVHWEQMGWWKSSELVMECQKSGAFVHLMREPQV